MNSALSPICATIHAEPSVPARRRSQMRNRLANLLAALIVLLCGGDKSSQHRDIDEAKRLAQEED